MNTDPLVKLSPLLNRLLTTSRDTLEDPPARVLLMPGGEVVWDGSENKGQLWIRVVAIVPHYPSGAVTGVQGFKLGAAAWDATIALGILRCVATVDDRGRPPKASKMSSETEQMLSDASTLAGILNQAEEVAELTAWTPLGPEGGLAGGEWQARTRFDLY